MGLSVACLIQTKFFFNTSICYELLLCVHHIKFTQFQPVSMARIVAIYIYLDLQRDFNSVHFLLRAIFFMYHLSAERAWYIHIMSHPGHACKRFFFSTLHLLRAVTLCTSLCMYHLSLYSGLASQAYYLRY
jgi:hypothetical protein